MAVNNFPLPSKNCLEGAELCFENASRLLDDACLLFANKRYITASCLAIYTIEEIGKGIELLALYENKKDLSESKWRDLSKRKAHIKKFLLDKN